MDEIKKAVEVILKPRRCWECGRWWAIEALAEMRSDLDLNDPEGKDTFERTQAQLHEVEQQLATRHNIRGAIRRRLFAMDRQGELFEDELVKRWHDLYASYLDWLERGEVWEESTPPDEPSCPCCAGRYARRRRDQINKAERTIAGLKGALAKRRKKGKP